MSDDFLKAVKKADMECALKYMIPLFEKFGLLNFYKLAQDGLIKPRKAHGTNWEVPLKIVIEDEHQHDESDFCRSVQHSKQHVARHHKHSGARWSVSMPYVPVGGVYIVPATQTTICQFSNRSYKRLEARQKAMGVLHQMRCTSMMLELLIPGRSPSQEVRQCRQI